MPILPFQPDVLKYKVQRVVVGERKQIDAEACLILNARLVGVDGDVTAIVYEDSDPTYDPADPDSDATENPLMALACKQGTSDSQNPLAPPTRADYGIFVKAEGTADKTALLELTYVHREDYERSFEPVKIEMVEVSTPALDLISGLPGTGIWTEDNEGGDGDGGGGGDSTHVYIDRGGTATPIGEDPDKDPWWPNPYPDGGHVYWEPTEIIIIEGQADVFRVRLEEGYTPLNDIVLSVTSGNTGDLTVSPSTLTFTPANFLTKQDITITAVNDSDTEGTESVEVSLAITTGDNDHYTEENMGTAKLLARILDTDSDTARVVVNLPFLPIVEGATDPIVASVSLAAAPTANVVVTVGNITGDGRWETRVTGSESAYAVTQDLTFTSGNWLTAQDVDVRATTNTTAEEINPLASSFTFQVTTTTDADYLVLASNGSLPSIPVLVYDNDAPNFATGLFIFQTEDNDYLGEVQSLITEGGNSFLRNE